MNAIFSPKYREKNSIPLFMEANIEFLYYRRTHWSKNIISIFSSILEISIVEMGWRWSKSRNLYKYYIQSPVIYSMCNPLIHDVCKKMMLRNINFVKFSSNLSI